MRDTIYKQDAIDAVAEGLKRTFVEYRDVAEKMLNKVPSAQPEILTCEDCKYADDKLISDGRQWCNIHSCFMYYCSDAER